MCITFGLLSIKDVYVTMYSLMAAGIVSSDMVDLPLQPVCANADGSRQLAVVAILCNFPKPTDDKPSLLTHSDVSNSFCWWSDPLVASPR